MTVRFLWLAPAVHLVVFVTTLLINVAQKAPSLDGPARFGMHVLFFADFPISAVAFSLIWDRRLTLGLLLWGVLGTVWWGILGLGTDLTLRSAVARTDDLST